jgi:voltage-gated potassium channel
VQHLAALYFRWRYLVLLGVLLAVLVVQPISFGFSAPPQLFDIFLVIVTLTLLLSFCTEKSKRLAAIVIGVPTGLLTLGGHLLAAERGTYTVVLFGHVLAVVFYFWAAVLIVASLIRRHSLSMDSVFGAICGYLLLGMAWGVLYSTLDTVRPDSFQIGDRLAEQLKNAESRNQLFTYYSFVTLTTVGYGDITPLSTPARTCAWLEALTGQFYIAVLVAGLVGALLSRKADADGSDDPHRT